ncbi:hypothetical protein D3C76_332420 [compost metagenome]
MRLSVDEAALQPLHQGTGEPDLRHAGRCHAENLGGDRHLLDAGQDHDHPLCAGLDPALDWRADDPQRGDGATAAGQRRHAGRRRERLARALQHPGADRSGPVVQLTAGLPHATRRCRTGLQRLHRQAHAKTLAPGATVLLAELRQIPRQPDESLVRRQRHGREQLGLRLPAETGHSPIRHPQGVRPDGAGQGQRLPVPGLQSYRCTTRQEPGDGGAGQAEMAGGDGSAGHRNLGVLAKGRAV